jgi:hypothetical protein
MAERKHIDLLRACWSREHNVGGTADYALIADYAGTFVARSQSGLAALVVPVPDFGLSAAGRRAAGCEVVGHRSIRFAYRGREWDGPAAALLCTDPALLEAFAVLAADVASRIGQAPSWQAILATVEEWQALLTPRDRPNVDSEVGLWGELWFLDRAVDIERLLAGWRGPDADVTDFFVGGVAAEIKTARTKRQHHVSQTQVGRPAGMHDAWLTSLWVKVDPASPVTVAYLADRILDRAPDQGEALRRMARAGFSPLNRSGYVTGLVLLDEPEWYAATDVPRVHQADPGVSQLRYRVTLDAERRAPPRVSSTLWNHFHGCAYGDES